MSRHMTSKTPVGVLIQRARHRKRMTQGQLAEALGVDRVTVAQWERGKQFPQRNAGLIEEVLGITIPAPDRAAGEEVAS